MPHHVTPTVFLIGHTVTRRDQVRKWLDHIGAKNYRIEDNVTPGEQMTQLAGRRCYKSFEPGLNPNVTRVRKDMASYIKNILEVGHGSVIEHVTYNFAIEDVSRVFCYTPETEVLTITGWKPVTALQAGELLLTKNPKTGQARWMPNLELHSFEYVGPVHYWENSEEQSPRITPDHTLWAANMYKRNARGLTAEEAADRYSEKIPYNKLAGKLFTVDHRIGAVETDFDPAQFSVGPYKYDAGDFAEWLGFVATDGTITRPEAGRKRVRVYQEKPQQAARLAELMDRLFPGRWKYNEGDAQTSFDISDAHLYPFVLTLIGQTKALRNLTHIFEWSPRLVSRFLKGAASGDGSLNGTDHLVLHCENPRTAGEYQVLYSKVGQASRVFERESPPPHQLPNGNLIVATRATQLALTVNKKGVSQCQPYMQRVIFHAGQVHCPRTEDGVVFVRHPEGRAMWCGNTGEMNRHRAGMAISEGSMRFIRYTDIPYWIPTSLQDAPMPERREDETEVQYEERCQKVRIENGKRSESRQVFEEAFRQDEKAYGRLCEIWQEELKPDSPFADKKHITSMMRRIVGMGVATGGVWSGNLRALRHVFAMRCAKEAEEEICLVATLMLRAMMEAEPTLFGDFTQDAGGFYAPIYRKV